MPEPIPISIASAPFSSQPADAAQRLRALSPSESFLVEAPAGSGKTELLIQRFLVLLARVSDPIQVLAITFTNKATAEMRQRILSALSEAAANQPIPPSESHRLHTRALALAALDNDRHHHWNLLDQPQRLHIRTIDSLCAEISSRLPLLARMGVALHPTERPNALYDEAARRTLLDLAHPDPLIASALRTLLLHRDNNLAECTALIAQLLPSRDQWGRHIPLGSSLDEATLNSTLDTTVRATFESAIKIEVERALALPTPHLDPAEIENMCKLVQHAEEILLEERRPSPYGGLHWHENPTCTVEHLEHWIAFSRLLLTGEGEWRKPRGIDIRHGFRPKSSAKAAIEALLNAVSGNEDLREALQAISQLPPPLYSSDQWRIAKSLFRVMHLAIGHLRVVFAETGTVDFTEQSIAAAHALREDTAGLTAALGTTIEHLLVDEFQDTSISQRDLLVSLTSGWDGHSQTVFLVGDPKQSIYLFRHAEVALFHSTRDHGLGTIPLTHLTLTANFRSRPALISQLNADFLTIFAGDTAGIEFTPSTAARSHSPQSQIAWHIPPPLPDGNSLDSDDAAQHEAATLCAQIQSLASSRASTGSTLRIAVLARNRNHLPLLMAALRAAAIPYTAIEIDLLGDRQPVRDLLALTRALLHPADRTAWLAVLRAPWCGLSLAALHILCDSDNESTHSRSSTLLELAETNLPILESDDQTRATRTLSALTAALSQRNRMPLSTLVERTWHTLGGPHCVDAEGLSASTQYLRLLGTLEESTGSLDAATIQDQIGQLYEESAPLPANAPVTVELLTMHKAKGLEWDVVFLPSLHRIAGNSRDPLLSWIELTSLEITQPHGSSESIVLLAPITGKGRDKDPLNKWIRRLRADREAAERKRLYYVACTRAREELHIYAAPKRKDNGEYSPTPGSLLHAAWPAAQQHFLPQPRTAEPDAAEPDSSMPTSIPASNLIQMPPHPSVLSVQPAQPGQLAFLAAVAEPTAEPAAPPQPIQTNQRRLPLDWQPSTPATLQLPTRHPASTPTAAFTRPQGGLESRHIGLTVHTFLELAVRQLAVRKLTARALEVGELEGQELTTQPLDARQLSPQQPAAPLSPAAPNPPTAAALPVSLPASLPASLPMSLPVSLTSSLTVESLAPRARIIAALRSLGLPNESARRAAPRITQALQSVLSSPLGSWILAPHPAPAALPRSAEAAISGTLAGTQRSFRLDRLFLAGPEPLAPGQSHLWIIDYKTAAHSSAPGPEAIAAFLTKQREFYESQMTAYARLLRSTESAPHPIRLALFYPLLNQLDWWPYAD